MIKVTEVNHDQTRRSGVWRSLLRVSIKGLYRGMNLLNYFVVDLICFFVDNLVADGEVLVLVDSNEHDDGAAEDDGLFRNVIQLISEIEV